MHAGRSTAKSSGLCVVAVTGAVALVVAVPALARPQQNLNAKVRALTTGLTEFSGRVTSTDPDCVKGRKIKISIPKQVLGNVRTEKDGRFVITRKSIKSGTDVTFELKARGHACIPLVASLTAP
jgi:hypothetical protein